jgi:hypothetical protein
LFSFLSLITSSSLLNQPKKLSILSQATIFHGGDEGGSKQSTFLENAFHSTSKQVLFHVIEFVFNKLSQLLSLLSDEKRDSTAKRGEGIGLE